MKCKVFVGRWYDAQDAFNVWAKGKMLTRDVLIQTQHIYVAESPQEHFLAIIVFHPEGKEWDATSKTLSAPIHDKPVEHIKESEIVITA